MVHFEQTLPYINSETKIFPIYLEIAKPLILCLPDNNDRVKALAWFRKIIYDNSNLRVRIEYIKLLLKYLTYRKLSGPFAGLPDIRRPLKQLNKRKTQQQMSKCSKLSHGREKAAFKDFQPENDDVGSILRSDYMKIFESEASAQCIGKNQRIMAGYSTLDEIENTLNSPEATQAEINKINNMLMLPPATSVHEFEANLQGLDKPLQYRKRQIVFNKFDVTRVYHNVNTPFGAMEEYNEKEIKNLYPIDYDTFQDVRKESKVSKISKEEKPVKKPSKKKENTCKTVDLPAVRESSKKSDLITFLKGPKKFFTLSVSKECMDDRNIFNCVSYIVANAQCSYFKSKENRHSKQCQMKKPKKCPCKLFADREMQETKVPNRCGFTKNESFFSCIRSNDTMSYVCGSLRDTVQESLYLQISLILTTGALFFWKLFHLFFTCQCKKLNNCSNLASQLYKIRQNGISPHVLTFALCYILYQIGHDFRNFFFC